MTLKLFISHSSHDEQTRLLRDSVAGHLNTQPDIEVLWDTDINPGDRWRSKLDQWLAECHGGVVLFSRDAVDSAWVLKEAQILTWRKAIVDHFPLVPVLLDPVTPQQTGLANWQPVRLNEIQFINGGDPQTMNEQARQALAEQITCAVTEQAGTTDFDSLADPLADWLENLADDLANAGASRLKNAALALGIGPGTVPSDDPHAWAAVVARRFLHFGSKPPVAAVAKETFDASADILRRLVRTFSNESKKRIADQFFPVWVHPDAVRDMCPHGAARAPVAINATYPETGKEYADRATCGLASERNRVIAVTDIHDGDPASITKKYHDALVARFHLDSVLPADWDSAGDFDVWKQALDDIVEQKGPVFVVLFGDGCVAQVAHALQQQYPSFSFVLMLGERATDPASQGLDNVVLLEPRLPGGSERRVRNLYEELL